MVTVTDETAGISWTYESETQARAGVRLYAMANRRHTLSVTINGRTSVVYNGGR